MKNIIKTVIVMLTSVSLFASANAGELTVNGTAKATYNIESGANKGKGLGITNELNFTASGELDNGYTWSYSMELDPGANIDTGDTTAEQSQSAHNDDTKLTLSTPYGTVGVFISEGGLDVEDAASQSVYSRPTDMGGSDGVVDNFTIDAYNNMQYHTPADLLPFGTSLKVAYAPDLDAYGSGNNGGGRAQGASGEGVASYAGTSANETQVSMNAIPMLDGLTIGASYFEINDQGAAKKDQAAESGAYYATYAIGNVSLGYSKAYKAVLITNDANGGGDATFVESYDQTNQSIAYVVNDDLSLSYEVEKSTAQYLSDATADVEQKSTGIQIAYNMGGMTIALARNSHNNPSYDATAADIDQTLLAVTMAF
jgi:outer membrane protein OmpU